MLISIDYIYKGRYHYCGCGYYYAYQYSHPFAVIEALVVVVFHLEYFFSILSMFSLIGPIDVIPFSFAASNMMLRYIRASPKSLLLFQFCFWVLFKTLSKYFVINLPQKILL